MYIHPLNYIEVLEKVVQEKYAPFKYHMLNLEQRFEAVGAAHKIMSEYMIEQKKIVYLNKQKEQL